MRSPRPKLTRFTKEIMLVLLLKAVALTLIWVFVVRGHDAGVDDHSMETALSFKHFQSLVPGGQHHD